MEKNKDERVRRYAKIIICGAKMESVMLCKELLVVVGGIFRGCWYIVLVDRGTDGVTEGVLKLRS